MTPLLIYDGECKFCDYWVSFVIRNDRKKLFYFVHKQSARATEWLSAESLALHDSVIVVTDQHEILYKTDAVLYIMSKLSVVWQVLRGFLSIFPRGMRNYVYDTIARNRYQWFGKYDQCKIPTLSDRERFLD